MRAKVKVLRTDEKPGGFGCHATLEVNEMVGRPVYLACTVMKLGGYFSIEISYYLRIWDLPFMLSRME